MLNHVVYIVFLLLDFVFGAWKLNQKAPHAYPNSSPPEPGIGGNHAKYYIPWLIIFLFSFLLQNKFLFSVLSLHVKAFEVFSCTLILFWILKFNRNNIIFFSLVEYLFCCFPVQLYWEGSSEFFSHSALFLYSGW